MNAAITVAVQGIAFTFYHLGSLISLSERKRERVRECEKPRDGERGRKRKSRGRW